MSRSIQRSLLVTFDAFGTLFSPRKPVAVQYADVARNHGINVDPADLMETFKTAFKSLSNSHPNYGKAEGMNPEDWWIKCVNDTFTPLIPSSSSVPSSLGPAMVKHFASSSAYKLHPLVPDLLHFLRSKSSPQPSSSSPPPSITLGIISNSDPRVPFILHDLGVGILHYHTHAPLSSTSHALDHPSPTSAKHAKNGYLDFLTLSYDVGVSKPDRGIFEAAERRGLEVAGIEGRGVEEGGRFGRKVHIGDEFGKDVEAARNAGWEGVLWREDVGIEEMEERILGEDEG